MLSKLYERSSKMTRIFVFSDSHGQLDKLTELVPTLGADYLIHCGDFAHDLTGSNVYHVRGNCDPWSKAPSEILLTIENKKILIVHGHRQHVKSGLLSLAYYAKQKQVDVVLFGHTHKPVAVEDDDLLLLNPGSISLPPPSQPASYLELTIDGDQMDFQFHYLEESTHNPE